MCSRSRVHRTAGAFVLMVLVLSCQERSVTAVDVADVAVLPSTAIVTVGAAHQFGAEVRDAGGNLLTGRTVTWSVEDPTRARSEGGGLIMGLAAGSTTVRAISGGVTGTAEITVMEPASIALSPEEVTLSLEQGAAQPATRDVSVTNANAGALTGLAATVQYAAGQPTGWLAASLSGTEAPATLSLSATAGSLGPGTYQASVTVVGAGGGAGASRTLPVELRVSAPSPSIQLEASSVSFLAVAGGPDPAPQTVGVTSAGGGALTGLGAAVTYAGGQPTDWLVATLSPSTAPSTLTLAVRTTGLAPGVYNATVDISSAVASNSPQSLPVTLTLGAQAPAISLSATSRFFTATAAGADPPAQSVTVSNVGGGSLSGLTLNVVYPAGQSTGWLGAALSATTAPATLSLQPVTGALAAGTYTAVVEVHSDVAANSPQTVAVTFQVNAPSVPPAIGLVPTSASFTAIAAGGNPASQTVNVSNTGGGTLSGLSTQIAYTSGQPTGWLAASLSATDAPSTLTLQATTGLLLPGTYTARVQVGSSAASNSPQEVAVTFQVTAPIIPPAIALNPASLSFSATAGGANPPQQTVDVTNSGGGTLDDLDVNVQHPSGQSGGWLTATLSSNTAPTQLSLSVTTGSLPPGTYTATVEVRSNKASNSPQTIAVTFTVNPAPAPALPAAPTNLRAENRGTTMIELTWNDNANNEAEYRVERRQQSTSSFGTIATLPANSTNYRDGGLSRSTDYSYRVLACNAAGCRESNIASARTN